MIVILLWQTGMNDNTTIRTTHKENGMVITEKKVIQNNIVYRLLKPEQYIFIKRKLGMFYFDYSGYHMEITYPIVVYPDCPQMEIDINRQIEEILLDYKQNAIQRLGGFELKADIQLKKINNIIVITNDYYYYPYFAAQYKIGSSSYHFDLLRKKQFNLKESIIKGSPQALETLLRAKISDSGLCFSENILDDVSDCRLTEKGMEIFYKPRMSAAGGEAICIIVPLEELREAGFDNFILDKVSHYN